jgi:hypothetical protein
MDIRALNRPEDQWTKAHFKVMCLYKKAPTDKGLPDSLPLLQQCWNERRNRLSPVSPGNPPDDKGELLNFLAAAEPGSPPRPIPAVVLVANSPADVSTLTENNPHGIQNASV